MGKVQDISGLKFNRLTAIEYNPETKKWKCLCECGNFKEIQASNLKNGATKSCGCLHKEKVQNNLIGKTFGKLTVVKDSGQRYEKHRSIIWECLCECGNTVLIRTDNLTTGQTYSCGCLKQSHEELNIENYLKEKNILYKKEVCFNDLLSPKGGYLRFDFCIYDNETNDLMFIIEFDGNTHDFSHIHGWNTTEKVKYQIKCDNLKNEYCLKNNIPLLRINYKDKEKMKEMIDTEVLKYGKRKKF